MMIPYIQKSSLINNIIETQVRNYSLVVGEDDGASLTVHLQWKDVNLLHHNINVVPHTLFDIGPNNITIKVLYSTLYKVSILHICNGPDSVPQCIGIKYCESYHVHNISMDFIIGSLVVPANCSGEALDTSILTVINCTSSQVLYTMNKTDTSCSGVETQVNGSIYTTGAEYLL